MRPAVPGSGPSPLVGRARERELTHAQLGAALAGRGGLVILSGEAGIGKTALAEDACQAADTAGALVLIGRCYDRTETPPYGPWLELIEQYRALPARSPARPTPGEPDFTHGPSQAALFDQVRAFLVAVARARPLVLLLDDLHWADAASLDLLRVVARHVATAPILVLATYRSDEVTRHHPLYGLLPALVREALAVRIDLSPLGANDVRTLIEQTYQLPVDDAGRLAAALWARSEGNPFFLGELLRSLQGTTLARTAAGWALGALPDARIPVLLRQVIDARLARLGAEAEELLAVAAVIGQVVPLALWATVGVTTEAALLPLVERAVAARVLDATPDGLAVRFAHALIREALYEGVLSPRRRAWHRAIGDALVAERAAPDPDAVAHHFGRAGDPRAVAWLTRAGERAQRGFAWQAATRQFEAALALLADDDTALNARGWLRFRLALVRRFTDPVAGAAALADAERLGGATADAALVAYARFYQGMFLCLAGRHRRGIAATEAGVALLDALSPADRGRLAVLDASSDRPLDAQNGRGELTLALGESGRFAQARALGERIVGLPTEQTLGSRGDAYCGLGYAHAALGQPAAAQRAFTLAREAFRAADQRSMVVATLFEELLLVILPYRADRPQERRRVEAALGEAFAALDAVLAPRSARAAGLVSLVLAGEWAEVFAILEQGGHQVLRLMGATLLAPLARQQGNAALAWQLVRQGLPDGPDTAPDDSAGFILPLRTLAVALALDAGELDAARQWLAALDRWLAWSGSVLGRAEAHRGWATYHRAAGDGDRAWERANQARHAAMAPHQPFTLLTAQRLIGELDLASGRLADAAVQLDAARALADACESQHERALTLLALADLCHASGESATARAHLAAVRALCAPMGAVLTLARADALGERLPAAAAPAPARPPAGLTAREAEVLRLLAAGLANAAIAARLGRSPRTVDAHLVAIYGKIGVASRGAAIRFALDHDLH